MTERVIDLDRADGRAAAQLKNDGVEINACYQCPRCTAGCPMLSFMDIPPSRVVRMLQTGQQQQVLRSRTIWMCASCHTCSTRCPNEVDVAHMMDLLRQQAMKSGIECPEPDVIKFHRAFIKEIARGRIHELAMIGRFKLATGKFTDDMKLGMEMFKRGRIKLLPSRLTGSPRVKAIIAKAQKGGGNSIP